MLTHSIRLPADHGLTRIEHDLLGDLAVPAGAYYGVQTARALTNFQITGIPLSHFPNFVRALAMVKKAAVGSSDERNRFGQRRSWRLKAKGFSWPGIKPERDRIQVALAMHGQD